MIQPLLIGFAGLSHLGIVSSIVAASKGFEVRGYDPDVALCDALKAGQLPVFEPGLLERLAAGRSNIRFTSDPDALRECHVIVCSSDVPTSAGGTSDLSVIDGIMTTILQVAASGSVIVVLSQVPPGFTRGWARRLAEAGESRGRALFSQVETLIFGQAVERAAHPERVIVGCADPASPLPAPYADYLAAFEAPVLRMRYESAEMAKLSINAMLVSAVSTANALAELCEAIGADWSDIVPALTLDRRIGPHAYLRPGLGLSGGNLERDVATILRLAETHGTETGLAAAWQESSRRHREWVLHQLHERVLSQWSSPRIAVWGLAYKPDTRSTTHAPALALLEALRGVEVRAYDPQAAWDAAAFPDVRVAASALEACREADALAIMTPWKEFRAVPPARLVETMRGRVVIDPFHVLDPEACRAVGLEHARLGVPMAQPCTETC